LKVVCLGGGPAGLFFAALLKQADARHDVTVLERNRPDDTFGFGVVFSDATEEALAKADPRITEAMAKHAHRWDDIEINYRGEKLVSTGHGFSGLSRRTLLGLLHERCKAAGVRVCFNQDVKDPETHRDADLVVAADGVHSLLRERYRESFRPSVDERPNRFVWLGTTRPFPAFTFYFKSDPHGLWRVHAYQYEPGGSTFIVEATEETWRSAGLEKVDEVATIAFCERLFAEELAGHRLVGNRSIWRRFPTIRNASWHHQNVVLLGDAAHTAHFSVGSGTKLAMEDSIALVAALGEHARVPDALEAYEAERRPAVESLQRAAQVSLQWFEDTERYMTLEPIQFAFTLLTRSLRVTHENLKLRDPAFTARVDGWFAERAFKAAGVPAVPAAAAPPPMFTPFKVRELLLANRVVVSPMCQYSAEDGMPNDWHLVHLGTRAIGGAGLVVAEMTDVSAEARISPWCTGLWKPEQAEAWRRIVDFVHTNSAARIAMQLGHAGRKASTQRMWEGDNQPLAEGNWPLVSASPLPYFPHSPVPRELSAAEMRTVVADYVRAAKLAEDAGFDLLELHMAHGYLLASFISPLTNRRSDGFGGPLANRMRFPLEVFDAVRAAFPAARPVGVRVSATDWLDHGWDLEQTIAFARQLAERGVDWIDVSSGGISPHQKIVLGPGYHVPFAAAIKRTTAVPIIAVGLITTAAQAEEIVGSGKADMVALARAMLFNPHWPWQAAAELGATVEAPPQYWRSAPADHPGLFGTA